MEIPFNALPIGAQFRLPDTIGGSGPAYTKLSANTWEDPNVGIPVRWLHPTDPVQPVLEVTEPSVPSVP